MLVKYRLENGFENSCMLSKKNYGQELQSLITVLQPERRVHARQHFRCKSNNLRPKSSSRNNFLVFRANIDY
ncbi:hypothetical protein NADFUDRAFT_82288 [Nadsonia fulvescens var. elongata DSM 6958]|uniref:Uncharacterized protein n=1 Tax=Nadsonia fulvescens var. elongata DSM 6958 TaxID=857566 RepID=A0A1E3PMC1_9ASCO|nr:hypothetical protein NADFUDRAFT_82288 [Nadsonia fulvescens var. elongata DSM 6958]